MPQMRIYHQGRYMYYRPGKTVHFLPPLHPLPNHAGEALGTRSVVMETASNDENVVNGRRRHQRTVQYRKLMDHIGNSLSLENIDDMKFLAKGKSGPFFFNKR